MKLVNQAIPKHVSATHHFW